MHWLLAEGKKLEGGSQSSRAPKPRRHIAAIITRKLDIHSIRDLVVYAVKIDIIQV